MVPGAGLGSLLTALALAKCRGGNMLQFAGLWTVPPPPPPGKGQEHRLELPGSLRRRGTQEGKLKGGGGTIQRSLGSVLQTDNISKQTQAGALSVTLTHGLCERNDQLETSCLGPSAPPWRATATQRLTSWEPWRRTPLPLRQRPLLYQH